MAGDPVGIAQWLRIDDRLTTSGRLVAGDIAGLVAIGVRHVINLALDDHPLALAGEAGLIAEAGMRFRHIPIPFDAPEEAHFADFAEAMAATGREPVHVHCIVNARVSAFVCRWRRDHDGIDEAEARAAMEKIWDPGTHPKGAPWARLIARPPLDTSPDSH